MAERRVPFAQALVRRVVASRPGSWLSARVLHRLDHAVLRLTGGRTTLTSFLGGVPVVMVTTTGAKSGLARTVPLLCIRDEGDPDRFALVASNWGQRCHPAWYSNLKANPHAICSIGGRAGAYVAREATGEEYERFWRRAAETYAGYPLYRQRAGGRHIPILVMAPVDG